MRITLVTIAKACHAINAAFCAANGDDSQPIWDEVPDWQRQSAINGVALHVTDEHMSPQASHEAWLEQKTREGWRHGSKKDPEKKLHPCFLPYDKLPPEQKAKDYLFKTTVAQFRPFLPGSELAAAAERAQEFKNQTVAAEKSPEQLEAEGPAEHERQHQLRPMTKGERKAAKKGKFLPDHGERDPTDSVKTDSDTPKVETPGDPA